MLEDVFKQLNCDDKGININGTNLNPLRFVDGIVLIVSELDEMKDMISDLKLASE